MANMTYPLYIFFGVLPSFAWLFFYLRKDSHPESNKMVVKIFFYGALAALPAVLLEMGLSGIWKNTALNIFIGVALVEEAMKFLVVWGKVLSNSAFDEPVDAALYMIIAALGFAAVENVLILFSLGPVFLFKDAFSVSIFRFLGATFLHALVSGTLGYFLALHLCYKKKRWFYILTGFAIAVFLHGLYNFSIMELAGPWQVLIPISILLGLAVFLTLGFKRLKQLKSVCLPAGRQVK